MIKLMEKTYFAITLLFVGLCLGSFVNAAVWRIKNKKNLTTERSECTHCHYKLEPKDLVPVLSWLWLKGRCRKCKKPISAQYPLVELAVAAYFVASLAFWPYGFSDVIDLLRFGIWLLAGVAFAILVVYDYKWMLLPDKVVFPLIGLGAATSILYVLQADSILSALLSIIGSVVILSGFYFFLYQYSKGKWIGFGDVKLGLALGLLVADWRLALLTLFLANFIGCIVVIPGMVLKKIKRNSHIPFGPFLIAGAILANLFGMKILTWYLAFTYSTVIL